MKKSFPPKNLEDSVLAAISFFDVFDRALNVNEIIEFLLGENGTEDEVRDLLGKNVNIVYKDDYFFIQGRETIVDISSKKAEIVDKYWDKVNKWIGVLNMVPFIQSVSICNNLALGNSEDSSDIDLFIITKKGRIFMARVFSTILFHLLGIRRHGKKISGRFCLSFFVSEDGMDLSGVLKSPVDPYMYYWMRSLVFKISLQSKSKDDFYEANKWFKFGNIKNKESNNKMSILRLMAVFWELLLGGFWANWIENLLEKIHIKRLNKNQLEFGDEADVCVNRKMLKFHNIDKRDEINAKFWERYNDI